MKYYIFLITLFFSINSFAYHPSHTDEFEVRYIKNALHLDEKIQSNLRSQPAWKSFLKTYPNWFVYFNEYNQKPHRAFGTAINDYSNNDIESSARNFIINELGLYSADNLDLVVSVLSENEKFNSISFVQRYNAIEILDSRLYIKMNKQNEVIMFGLDVFTDISLSVIPNISEREALLFAQQDLPYIITDYDVNSHVKILPIPFQGKYDYRLVYIVNLVTENNIGPAHYICYVDANTGELLMRRNEIKFELPQANIHVEGEVYTTNPFNSSSIVDFVDLKVIYNNINYYTDDFGDLVLPSNSGNATFSLEGLYTQVRTNNVTPSFIGPVSNPNVVFDNSNSSISERTAFAAVNNIHTHFKNQFPTFTGLDFALETNVDDQTADCNAFYSGGGWGGSAPSINFYAEGGGCQATASIPDVAYHEYGHAINDYRYNGGAGMWNGALNEGTADIWALSLTQYPVLGEGWYLNNPNSNVREYDSTIKVYPQDLVGEVHADGEIICGAFWHTYENLGDMQQALDLFASIYDGGPDGPDGSEGIIYTDILLEFLYTDDNDGNIFNGTPNDNAIIDAFALHGITLLSNATITHNAIDSVISNTVIDINASITGITQPWALSDAYCFYKINMTSNWDSIPLSLVSGTDYEAQIPAQSPGTIVSYYFAVIDKYGKKSAITPFSADLDKHANLPYFILCGYTEKERYSVDIINGSLYGYWDVDPDQTDLAITGEWTEAEPIGNSTANGTPVQPDFQVTPGGDMCMVTGNGSVYAADDIDDGNTTVELKPDIFTPYFDLTSYTNPAITYYRWYSNNTGANPANDWWQVKVSDDGGNSWVYVENNKCSDNSWRRFAFRVKDYVSITDEFLIRFIASDSILDPSLGLTFDGGSVVEAAIDDVSIYDQSAATLISENNINIEVYPTPTNGVVYIENFDKPLNIRVINILGETVMEKELTLLENKIDLSKYSKGIYYLDIKIDKQNITKKIVLE